FIKPSSLCPDVGVRGRCTGHSMPSGHVRGGGETMSTYVGLLAMLVLALLGVGAAYLLWRATTVHPESVAVKPFLSGFDPQEHALSRFHARWYPMTLLFLAFDVEMLFMYP